MSRVYDYGKADAFLQGQHRGTSRIDCPRLFRRGARSRGCWHTAFMRSAPQTAELAVKYANAMLDQLARSDVNDSATVRAVACAAMFG